MHLFFPKKSVPFFGGLQPPCCIAPPRQGVSPLRLRNSLRMSFLDCGEIGKKRTHKFWLILNNFLSKLVVLKKSFVTLYF